MPIALRTDQKKIAVRHFIQWLEDNGRVSEGLLSELLSAEQVYKADLDNDDSD